MTNVIHESDEGLATSPLETVILSAERMTEGLAASISKIVEHGVALQEQRDKDAASRGGWGPSGRPREYYDNQLEGLTAALNHILPISPEVTGSASWLTVITAERERRAAL